MSTRYLMHLSLFTALCLLSLTVLRSQEISSPTEYRSQPFDVKKYDASVVIDEPTSKHIRGKCDVVLTWTQGVESPTFPIHLRGIAIDSIISHRSRLTFDTLGAVSDDTFHFKIDIGRSVVANENDTITVFYSGVMTNEGGPNAWGGVHYSDSVLYALGVGFKNDYVSATQHWLPCYDHPSDKATLKLNVVVPSKFTVASVGVLRSVSHSADGTTTAYEWEEVHECATYLYTFAIARFILLEFESVNGIPVHVYSRPRDTSASRVSYKLLPRMTEEEGRLFGSYPFDKVGYVNTPKGAMEHQTMVSFPISLVNQRDTVNSIAAHELAHQWFGDLVTPQDFRHAWLTESFATYTEAAWEEHLFGWEHYLTVIAEGARNYITGTTRDEGVFALYDFPRNTPSSNYPSTIYGKGQGVLAMARAFCGTEAFYGVLRHYLDTHKFGVATTEIMKEEFRPALGTITDVFFDEWVYSKGWPRIEVDIQRLSGPTPLHTITLRQTQHNEFPDWPVFTTLPLNVTYRDPVSDVLIDTMFIITGSEFTFDVGSLNGFALNNGSKCRSLVQIIKTTSVNLESETPLTCNLYPSPANDVVELELHGNETDLSVDVYSLNGQLICSSFIPTDETHLIIPTHSFSSGEYTVVLHSNFHTLAMPMTIIH